MSVKRGNWESCLQYAVVSDVGMRRDNNQDAYATTFASDYSSWLDRNNVVLLMVADGMGAHAAGELASKLAVDGVPHLYQKYAHLSAPEALKKAIQETNAEVHRRGQANPDFNNMGTTVSVLLLLPQGAMVGHIGDSRIYMLRKTKLQQLTFDHSLVWEMRKHSHLPKDADLNNSTIPKNVITRSLGPYPEVEIDVEGPVPVQQNDVFLLCTDGLTGKVTDDELAGILAYLEPPRAANLLIDLANLRGGPDNITAIVAKVVNERMATAAVAPAPIVMGRPESKPTLPLAWIAGSVLVLASLLALIIEQWLIAGGLLIAAVLSPLVALLAARVRGQGGVSLLGRKLGGGPYVTVDVPGQLVFARQLKTIVAQLRQTARQGRWEDNPQDLDSVCQTAEQAIQRNDGALAVRSYTQVIHDLMGRLRAYHSRGSADTTIDWKGT